MSSPSDWREIEDIAEELRVSRATVFRLIKEGELARIKIGLMSVVTQTSFDAYVKRQEQLAHDEAEARRAARTGGSNPTDRGPR